MSDLEREIAELRERLRRYQVVLGVVLAVFGLATLAAISLVGVYGFRLANSLSGTDATLAALREETVSRTEALEGRLEQQQEELAAIRRAANEPRTELEAMREANRKLESVRDPAEELSALREANEALWQELRSQRAELREAFPPRSDSPPAASAAVARFRLGETSYLDPEERPDAIQGFVNGGEKVFRASALPSKPAHLVIEIDPAGVEIGEPYRLSVRLVNRSNRPIATRAMRLDWSFQGKNTGGDVPVRVDRVEPQESTLLYAVSGQWTEAHSQQVRLTATVTVDEGARVSNVLSW